jgi:hypothetical protein
LPAGPSAPAVEPKGDKKDIAISPAVAMHKHSIVHNLSVIDNTPSESRQGVVADKSPAPQAASSNEVAVVEVPVATPSLMIEGDATVADYDATTGLVETHEGKSFAIGLSAGASNSWDDYSGHVHYRCDGGGNCTLSRSGVVVPHARLTT